MKSPRERINRPFSKGKNQYWLGEEGYFSISDEGGWLPGAYENEEAADLAHDLLGSDALKYYEAWDLLQRLQDEANARNGGMGGVITVADLKAIKQGGK